MEAATAVTQGAGYFWSWQQALRIIHITNDCHKYKNARMRWPKKYTPRFKEAAEGRQHIAGPDLMSGAPEYMKLSYSRNKIITLLYHTM